MPFPEQARAHVRLDNCVPALPLALLGRCKKPPADDLCQ